MRRAERLFEIVQLLRMRRGPVTAAALAERLEVGVRTVYRDIADLQARRVPIEGAAGIGYVLRAGYDLPPLMFTIEEIDAVAVGVRMVRRLRDARLHAAAERVLDKVALVLPGDLGPQLLAAPLYVSEGSAPPVDGIDLSVARHAIRERRKMRLVYADEQARQSERTVWPVAMAYYVDATLLAAWCELRGDYRHFRADRIVRATLLDERYPDHGGRLAADWLALQKERPA
jgi:predicted DNA-binding transcriptional regulator YafY